MTSNGYAEVWDTRPATPPEKSSAQERSGAGLLGGELEGLGSVVYCARAGCRRISPAVSCVRKEIPA
jgi:hypothetical protein